MQNKVLIVGPDLKKVGGVAIYYKSVLPYLNENIQYFTNGSRTGKNVLVIITDFFQFIGISRKYTIIHFNFSMEYKSLIRDIPYLLYCFLVRKKYIVSLMGWNEETGKKINYIPLISNIIAFLYRRASFQIVLAQYFINVLKSANYLIDKHISICPPYDLALEKFIFAEKNFNNSPFNIMFMGRIEVAKGIFKAADIFKLLQEKFPEKFLFAFAGDGSALNDLKGYCQEIKLKSKFFGNISSDNKINVYNKFHMLVFPSEHGEGFPLLLAEVMYSGIIVVTSNAGGIGSILNNSCGAVIEKSASSNEYAATIFNILNENNLSLISKQNREFAQAKFAPIAVAENLKNIYKLVS